MTSRAPLGEIRRKERAIRAVMVEIQGLMNNFV
jgi:hypothetical protein